MASMFRIANLNCSPVTADCLPIRGVATLLVFCTVLFAIFGCGSKLKTYPVNGKVHFPDGKPLPGGIVIFISKETGIQSRARIQEDGTYELGTLEKDDGSISGEHRVAVQPMVLGPGMAAEHPIARRLQSVSTSGLAFTVQTDEPNNFDIEVEQPEPHRLRRESMNLPDL